jgi:hypothetical protein
MPRTTALSRTRRFFPLLGGMGTALLLALLAPVSATAQDGGDWCDDSGSSDHCEVRELTLEARNGALEVNASPNGGIRVEGWNGNEIRVQARVTTRARTDGDAADLAREVEILSAPGRLSTEGPRTRGRTSWSVSYRIQVPVGTDLDLSTTNGGISVTGVRAAVEARSTNGGIRLEDVEGAVRARTTNGGVQAYFSQGAELQHDTDLQTTNGAVSLHLPEGVSARIEASTRNGGITTDFPITVFGRLGRNLSGILGDGGPEIRIRTTNGPVRIRRI